MYCILSPFNFVILKYFMSLFIVLYIIFTVYYHFLIFEFLNMSGCYVLYCILYVLYIITFSF